MSEKFEQQVVFTNFLTKQDREYLAEYKKAEKKLDKRYFSISMLCIVLAGIFSILCGVVLLFFPLLFVEYPFLKLLFLCLAVICIFLIILLIYIQQKELSAHVIAEKIATEKIGQVLNTPVPSSSIEHALKIEEEIKEYTEHRQYAKNEFFIVSSKHYLSEYGNVTCIIEYVDGSVIKMAKLELYARLEWSVLNSKPIYSIRDSKFTIPNADSIN